MPEAGKAGRPRRDLRIPSDPWLHSRPRQEQASDLEFNPRQPLSCGVLAGRLQLASRKAPTTSVFPLPLRATEAPKKSVRSAFEAFRNACWYQRSSMRENT